jgi:hypothetical protein
MVSNGISVVQVNPYAVKQTKEVEDNSQLKDDRKGPKLIANLVKDGNYGMLYLSEGVYAELRRLSRFRDQITEYWIRNMNWLDREMKIYFPEYKDSFGKHKGETKISHRGRKRQRYWLFQAARSAVVHAEEFKELHGYYTTRQDNGRLFKT